MKRLILFSLLLLSSLWLKAQTHYVDGFIVKHEGDTIHGLVDSRGDKLMHSICRFKKHKKSAVEEFKPTELAAYRLAQGKFYVVKEYEGNYYFFEYLINGELDIYYLRTAESDQYFIEKAGQPLTLLPYEESTIYRNDVEYAYKSTQHKNVLEFYTEDAPSLTNSINSINQPGHRSLIKLAKSYHETICPDGESCIIYQREIPLFKMNPELTFGIVTTREGDIAFENKFTQIGVQLHIWLPRSNEKIYFKTGLIKQNITIEEEKVNLFKVPLQLEYLFPKWFIRPTVAYGLNCYLPFYISNALNLGVQLEVAKNVKLRFNTEVEFSPSFMFLIPSSYALHSYNFGLYINF